jgi:hypothetical protein
MTVKAEVANIERLGTEEAVEKTSRHTKTPIADVPHTRRRLEIQDWQWADLIDEEDQIRMLISPKSEYAKSGAWSMNRQYDRLIIAAASGDATDGDGNSVSLPSSQKIAVGTSGMTLDKVIEAKKILDENEVDAGNRYMVVSAQQMADMLATTEVSSSDFNSIKALVRGDFTTWMGFEWVQTELIAGVGTAAAKCLAFHKSGLRLGIGRDVIARVDKRIDVSYADQVYLAFTAGATRVEEEKVVEITCDAT